MTALDKYKAACDFPGVINDTAVEASLAQYLTALGVNRRIRKLRTGWTLREEPEMAANISAILADFSRRRPRAALDARAARDASDALDARDARDALAALDARDARDALDARDASAARDALDARDASDALDASAARAALDEGGAGAIKRFAAWCIYRRTWWWAGELSWLSTTHVGALTLEKSGDVTRWSKHVFDAYIAGAWILYWTETTLYWVEKPTVTTEVVNGLKRLHNDRYATLTCAIENLYFWHGVMVPAFIVVRPDWITVRHIETEDNAEVRRVMIERYGQARYLLDSGAEQIHHDDYGTLYRKNIPNDEPIVMVKLVNSTAEPDGTFKDYFLRVDPLVKTAREAVAWTFDVKTEDYAPTIQT